MTIDHIPDADNQLDDILAADCQLDDIPATDSQLPLNRFDWWPDGIWPYLLIAAFIIFIWLFYPLLFLIGLILLYFWFTL